ncbi:MAG TPA: Gfo/Idh/MocA family oxidoreductase [Micromonosporaceae bacterium]
MSSATPADLRVAILGYGIGGRGFHAPLVRATPGLTVAAIVTSHPDRVRQAAAEHPDARIVADVDALFGQPDRVDLVVVATPNRTHVPIAMRAVGLGIPVVVDKPFAPTAAEATELIEAAAAAGVALTVFHNRRLDSDFRTVRAVLDSGRLGTVFRFESRFDRWRPRPKGTWRDAGAPAEAGGLLYDLGSHLIDQAVQLFGPVGQVYAELDQRRPGASVDDDIFLALRHRGGVRSHLWSSTLAATRNPRFRVLGDQAAFTKYGLDVQEAQILAGIRPGDRGWGVEPAADQGVLGVGEEVVRVPTETGCYQRFYEQMRDALHGAGPVPVDPADARHTAEVIDAARISAARQLVVPLA